MSIDWNLGWNEELGALTRKGVQVDGGAGIVTVATEIVLRVLSQAEKALAEGILDILDGLAEEYWRINLKDRIGLREFLTEMKIENDT